MGKFGGNRNFGFGKKMAWAGKQALRERYGDGHHRSVAAHAERWAHFLGWARDYCTIRDTRHGALNVTKAPKWGRSRRIDRWVPVSATVLESLRSAAAIQGAARNLVPPHLRVLQPIQLWQVPEMFIARIKD